MEKQAKIFVAGHRGLVGSAILRKLRREGFENLTTRTHDELDLTDQSAVRAFFAAEKPEYVVLAAAKVGGILANSTYPADFIYRNLAIAVNVIECAREHGVKKLLNLGSSCIYPRLAPQPMREESLLSGPLELTNEAYAVAKIAAIKLCHYYNRQHHTNFISAMPTNQYGPNDNFNMETAHLLPMLIRRFHLAKLLSNGDFQSIAADLARYRLGRGLDEQIDFRSERSLTQAANAVGAFRDRAVVWGDGSVYREMMHSDDLADGCFFLLEHCDAADTGEFVNLTGGTDIRLGELIDMTARIVGFTGRIEYDATKPNGTFRKLMDAERIARLGWKPSIELADGIRSVYDWYTSKGTIA